MNFAENTLWSMACCGETEKLKRVITTNESVNANTRIQSSFEDRKISLIMGAYRNRNFDTVEMLIANGGTVENHEIEEITPYINTKRIDVMESIIYVLMKPAECDDAADFKDKCLSEYMKQLNTYTRIIEPSKEN
jgi:hypothetical protein